MLITSLCNFQLEIIDACVEYIEALQNQLNLSWSCTTTNDDGSKKARGASLLCHFLPRNSKPENASVVVKKEENLRHNVRMR